MPVGVVLLWTLILAAAALFAVISLMLLRRRLFGSADDSDRQPLTLDQIRTMRAAGQIDEREYQALRAAALTSWGVGGSVAPEREEDQPRRSEPGFDLTGSPLPPSSEPPS